MKHISFSDEAKADVRQIPKHIALNILKSIHRFAETGTGDLRKLQDSDPPEFRLRVGDYRIRFSEEQSGTLRIHAVKNRKDAYRK